MPPDWILEIGEQKTFIKASTTGTIMEIQNGFYINNILVYLLFSYISCVSQWVFVVVFVLVLRGNMYSSI